jgi:dipeptidyl aminopeptidase/acylaminoacyl peptidase
MINPKLLVACLALLGMSSLAPTADIDRDVAAFAALPLIERPLLSPDGKRYAALLSLQGRQLLAVMPTRDSDAKRMTLEVGEDNELISWHWVNDQWLLLRLAGTSSVQGDPWRITRAFGLEAATMKLVPIARDRAAQHGAELLWIARDGTPRVLLGIQQSIYSSEESFYPEVFEVDVSTGKLSSRAGPRTSVMNWYADGDGQVRIGVGYNDRQRTQRMLYRNRNGELFRTLDKADLSEGEELTVPAIFLADPKKALAFSDQSGFLALYEFDLEQLKLGEPVFSVPGYDLDSVTKDPSGHQLLGAHFIDTRLRTQWMEPVMAKAQRDLDKALAPDRHAQIISTSADQRRLVVQAASASDPGAFYLTDLDDRRMQPLSAIRPELMGRVLGPVRSLRYKARDGLVIEAVLTLPPGLEPRKLPLVVMPHGGPTARDDESFDWWAQFVASMGYAVIQPNYRGSSGYGTAFEDKADGQYGLAMQDDLLDAIDHLAREGIADPARVCMVGGSYGGYAALRAAQRDGARFRCVVSFAGVADLNAMMRYDSGFLYGASLRRAWQRAAPDLKAVSPANFAAQFSAPVLLMHGKRDRTVPVKQSREMAERLQAAKKDFRYVELPLADHHFSREADRLAFLGELRTFLLQHNPPR